MATIIKAVKQFVRTNTETPWYEPTEEAQNYMNTTYVQPGHRLSHNRMVSPDGLTLSITTTWTDLNIYNKFYNDKTLMDLMYSPRRTYNDANDIKGLDVDISSETVE